MLDRWNRPIDRRTALRAAATSGLGAALEMDKRSPQSVFAQETPEPEKPSLRQQITDLLRCCS